MNYSWAQDLKWRKTRHKRRDEPRTDNMKKPRLNTRRNWSGFDAWDQCSSFARLHSIESWPYLLKGYQWSPVWTSEHGHMWPKWHWTVLAQRPKMKKRGLATSLGNHIHPLSLSPLGEPRITTLPSLGLLSRLKKYGKDESRWNLRDCPLRERWPRNLFQKPVGTENTHQQMSMRH